MNSLNIFDLFSSLDIILCILIFFSVMIKFVLTAIAAVCPFICCCCCCFVCLFVCLFGCLFVCWGVCLFVRSFVCFCILFVFLFCLFVCFLFCVVLLFYLFLFNFPKRPQIEIITYVYDEMVQRRPPWLLLTNQMGYSIWIPHTPCGRSWKHLKQWECAFQIDKLIWHF